MKRARTSRDERSEGTLWRAAFSLTVVPPFDLLDRLDDLCDAISIFEDAWNDDAEPARWRIEFMFKDRPNANELANELEEALAAHGIERPLLDIERIAHRDWLEHVRTSREPFAVGRFFVHGQDEDELIPAHKVGLLIEPGLAFGSGEHVTTRSCLEALDRLIHRRRFRRILDLGCGSGILAVAAARVLRCHVVAADNDPLAVRATIDNALRNGVARQVETIATEGYGHPLVRRRAPFDLIFANILADPLVELAPLLRRHLAPGGFAILAGLLTRQAPRVVAAHERNGMRLVRRIDEHPWTALVMTRSSGEASRRPFTRSRHRL